ncbi:hypothetical protein L3Q82_017147 [Scortum barcoo]|uniref:Uncharacterized protein n=1 Tax=Scortum barcoo TaxID=214431 RepID=A0ACB8XAG7_9TELE|nr:hypothetical protein L3Q82_017147 [Scortum barcoo]
MGVCPTSPHVLCGSGEGIRPCPSWYSVGSAPRVWGPGPLLRAVRSLYDRSRSLVCIAGSKSDLFPVHVGLQQGLHFVAGPHLPNPRPWFLTGKGWRALSGWVERSCLKWRSSSIPGSCSRVRERWSVRLTGGWIGAASAVMMVGVPDHDVMVKKELSRKGKALRFTGQLIYVPTLTYGCELLGNDRKNKIADTSGQNEFPPQGGWALN